MPNREESVKWLREAAEQSVSATVDFRKRDLFLQRAVQVEAMRCETCAKYDNTVGQCGLHGGFIDNDFCCFHHEQKKPAG